MSTFRILHISDLHYCLHPSRHNLLNLLKSPKLPVLRALFKQNGVGIVFPASYDQDLAEAVAKFAYANQRVLDLVMITGDIATTGLKLDLEPAFEFVDGPATDIWLTSNRRPTLQGARKDIFLLPGNHDRYRDNWGNAGGVEFDAVFRKYWPKSVERVQHLVITKASDNERLALIGVDFSLDDSRHAKLPSVINRYGQGRAYRGRLKNLIKATKQVRDRYEKVAVIWVMHFPPHDKVDSSLSLIGANLVRMAANRYRIPIITAGHVHQKVDLTFNRTRLICAGSATSLDAGHGNWIHTLEFDVSNGNVNRIKRTDHVFDQTKQAFV